MLSINDIFTVRKDLVDIIDVRNDKLSSINNHNLRVSEMSVKLAAAIGFPPEDINQVLIGSYLHDIGKIFLESEILEGNLPLTDIQREDIFRHTKLGHSYLNGVIGLDKAKEIILYHHERVDGEGYPFGLIGSEIPAYVRLVSICDSYDAMTSYRAYKSQKMTREEAIRELQSHSGSQFDAEYVEIFINLINNSYRNN